MTELEVGVLECGRGEATLQAKNVIRTVKIEVRPLELLRCLLVVLAHLINSAVEREVAREFPRGSLLVPRSSEFAIVSCESQRGIKNLIQEIGHVVSQISGTLLAQSKQGDVADDSTDI